MPKLSVVIPIYNAEDFLEKCVDSVLKQTENDIEIILVDDGSKDKSLLICNKISAKDKRVKVIHQKNAGVSAARNCGIAVANGEYIGFIDADDWIAPNMYERLLSEAKNTNADIVMCDALTVYSDGTKQADTITQLSKNQVLQKTDFSPSLLLEMAGSAWRCIYKNYRHTDKQPKSDRLRFPLGVIFNIYAFGFANKISYIKEPYYFRFINKKSAVHRFHDDYFETYKKAAIAIEKAISIAWNNKEEYKTAYLSQFITGSFMAICNYYYKTSTLTRRERINAVEKICDDVFLRDAIKKYGDKDFKSKLILNNKINLLIMYAKLSNLKHKR